MNPVKKLLAPVLCLLLVLSVLPGALAAQPVPAAPTEIRSGSCGDSVSWSLNTETGALLITGSGDMTSWSNLSDVPWYNSRSAVRSVVIGSGVTSIGGNAFRGCTNMADISIPDTVTAIGSSVFADCYALTEIRIPGSVRSVGGSLFVRCRALTSVTLEPGVPLISGYMFAACEALEELSLPTSIASINTQAFQYCRALRSLTIPAAVTSIGSSAFEYCDALTELRFVGSAPTIHSSAFNGQTMTARYPAFDPTWTADKLQNYGGTITWEASLPDSGLWGRQGPL